MTRHFHSHSYVDVGKHYDGSPSNIWIRNDLVKRSVTNVRILFSEKNGIIYILLVLLLVLFERQEIITFHQVGCQNKCHLVTACLIPKSLRFRSVLYFRVATKKLFYQNSTAKFISFYFLRAFFINQIL